MSAPIVSDTSYEIGTDVLLQTPVGRWTAQHTQWAKKKIVAYDILIPYAERRNRIKHADQLRTYRQQLIERLAIECRRSE